MCSQGPEVSSLALARGRRPAGKEVCLRPPSLSQPGPGVSDLPPHQGELVELGHLAQVR